MVKVRLMVRVRLGLQLGVRVRGVRVRLGFQLGG